MNRVDTRSRSAGLTLIELMIALAIGSLLILGLVQVFSASRTAYQLSEGMSRAQENARFAMDYLQRDIRMAGHYGCVNDQSHLQTPGALTPHFDAAVPAAADPLDFAVSIQGYEAPGTAPGDTLTLGAAWSPAPGLPPAIAGLTPNPLPGSDIIVLRYLSNEGAPVDLIGTTGTAETVRVVAGRWDALTSDGVATPTLFGIADCSNVDIFAGTGTGMVTVDASATPATNLGGRYTPQPSGQTSLYRAESLVYYIALNTALVPALYRARFNGSVYTTEELVEGIENLQILYGRDRETNLADNPPSGYIDVQTVANAGGAGPWGADDWRRVGLVQVGLLARSPGPAAAGQAAADQRSMLGVDFAPPATNDTLYRATYEATIALRNRLYGN